MVLTAKLKSASLACGRMTVTSVAGYVENWQELEKILLDNPQVTAVAPYVNAEVLITHANSVQPEMLTGVQPDAEKKISGLSDKMVEGALTDLVPKGFGIVLGEELANRLDAIVGDKVTLITPQVSLSPAGVLPRYKRFTVVGIFRAGSGFGFDVGL